MSPSSPSSASVSSKEDHLDEPERLPTEQTPEKRVFYRTTFFAATVLGLCNFAAPGIWGAMNSLGAGGAQSPWLVNGANALTFGLMVVTATLTPVLIRFLGVKWSLFFGAAGYAPYAAALYCNISFGTKWFVLVGAALCGISAGVFWAVEAAVALSYPEPKNQGRHLGWWMTFRVAGPVLGGAINLGINAQNSQRGSVNPKVYLAFIAIQAIGPLVALLLPAPSKVQRTDGLKVILHVDTPIGQEVKETLKLFASKRFLLIVPLICQAVFNESFTGTYLTLYFSVRARALGSFLGAIMSMIAGNLLGAFLDRKNISLKTRARLAFGGIMTLQGAWWIWSTIIQSQFKRQETLLDWSDSGFGRGFALYLFIVVGFQLNYMYLYFLVGNLVQKPVDIIRIAGLLRATESAAQAVAYGTNAIESLGTVGSSAINFGLWGISVVPAWFVIRKIGIEYFGRVALEAEAAAILEGETTVTPQSEKSPRI
ncbi:hypothetical protein FFLO_05107 [Filobasidium floriforme]|uniref:Uncharacterized protein n=1 Tax=Filobasidium floriforme TaxID=5210 RepID=A0A8K0JN07_9TREE|nr:hypothetical protein FFLO_05107 [Filobasidium floriforme]